MPPGHRCGIALNVALNVEDVGVLLDQRAMPVFSIVPERFWRETLLSMQTENQFNHASLFPVVLQMGPTWTGSMLEAVTRRLE